MLPRHPPHAILRNSQISFPSSRHTCPILPAFPFSTLSLQAWDYRKPESFFCRSMPIWVLLEAVSALMLAVLGAFPVATKTAGDFPPFDKTQKSNQKHPTTPRTTTFSFSLCVA